VGGEALHVHVDQVDVTFGTQCLLGSDALFRLNLATEKLDDGTVRVSFNRVPSPARLRPPPTETAMEILGHVVDAIGDVFAEGLAAALNFISGS